MTTKRYSIGIRLEGIGSDPAKSEGIAWYWGNDISAAQNAASNFEWIGEYGSATGLASGPQTLDTSVDPFTADVRSSSYRFELHFGVVERLLFTAAPPTTSEHLNEGLDDDETSITLSSGYDAGNDGDVVWIGDEAILLGTYDGAEFDGCTRSYFGTSAMRVPRYVAAFTRNPYVTGRRVDVIRFDHADDSETIIWRGFVDEWEGSADGTRIIITCRETLAVLKDARVNLSAPDLSSQRRGTGVSGGTGRRVRQSGGQMRGFIAPTPSRRLRLATSATHWAAFQVGEGLFFARWSTADARYVFDDADKLLATDPDGSRAQLGSELPDKDELDPIYELLAIVRARDHGNGTVSVLTARRSGSAELTYPWHPIAICMALFLSSERTTVDGYDVWGSAWGLAAPGDWFDLTDINAVIAATSHVEIDQLILGWDGEDVTPWEQLQSRCREYGFFPVVRPDGTVSFREFRDAAVDDVATAPVVTTIPDTLHWMPRRGDSVDVLTGRFGALPWDEGRPFELSQVDTRGDVPVARTSRRAGILAQRKEQQFDMPTRFSITELAEVLTGMATARGVAAPRMRVRVLDDDFGLGDFVRVDIDTRDPWLPDDDGVAFEPAANSAKNVGLVLGMKRNIEEGTADIEVMMLNRDGAYARLRAPSAEFAGTGTAPAYGITNTAFTSADHSQFTVGDKVEHWGANGARKSAEIREIETLASGTITVDTAFGTTPVAGDILRLAHLDDADGFPLDGNSAKFDGFRAYAYLADTSDELSPDDIDGDIYGIGSG